MNKKNLNSTWRTSVCFLLCIVCSMILGCASVRKNSSSTSTQQTSIDTSSRNREWNRETVVTERADSPITTAPDSVQNRGYVSAEDTTGYVQHVETDGVSLTTSFKPRIVSGKITGYDISGKAVAKPQVVNLPVNKTTTTKESGNSQQKTSKSDVTAIQTKTSSKQAWRPSAGMVIGGVIGLIILIAGLIIYKWFNK